MGTLKNGKAGRKNGVLPRDVVLFWGWGVGGGGGGGGGGESGMQI